jgi:hypothetical protein
VVGLAEIDMHDGDLAFHGASSLEIARDISAAECGQEAEGDGQNQIAAGFRAFSLLDQ